MSASRSAAALRPAFLATGAVRCSNASRAGARAKPTGARRGFKRRKSVQSPAGAAHEQCAIERRHDAGARRRTDPTYRFFARRSRRALPARGPPPRARGAPVGSGGLGTSSAGARPAASHDSRMRGGVRRIAHDRYDVERHAAPVALARRARMRYNGRHAEEHLEIFPAVVFLSRRQHNVMAATIKCALATRVLTWTQTAASQAFFGALLFAASRLGALTNPRQAPVSLYRPARAVLAGAGPRHMHLRAVQLRAHRLCCYVMAITLLFQFTWIGIVFQVVACLESCLLSEVSSRRPSSSEAPCWRRWPVLERCGHLDPLGILCALLSAVSCATVMFLSARRRPRRQ